MDQSGRQNTSKTHITQRFPRVFLWATEANSTLSVATIFAQQHAEAATALKAWNVTANIYSLILRDTMVIPFTLLLEDPPAPF